MGLFWTYTFFANPDSEGIFLTDSMQTPRTGTYDKCKFIEEFGNIVRARDITEDSYIEECIADTYTFVPNKTIIRFAGL